MSAQNFRIVGTASLISVLLLCAAFKPVSHHKLGQLAAGEPDALFRAQTNLTKPLAHELLPTSITDASGNFIAQITDAQYCGPTATGARVLAQITQGLNSPAAANLLIADCTGTLASVVARHQSDVGFSGVLEVTVAWSNWTLTRTVATVTPAEPAVFSAQELKAIQKYSSQVPTDKVVFSSSNNFSEVFALAFAFANDTIAIGVFQGTQAPNADWSNQAQPITGNSIYTNNSQFAVSHSLLQTLLFKYQTDLTISTTINNQAVTFDHIFEATLPLSAPHVTGVRIGTTATSPATSFCKIHITTDWSSAPLAFQAVNAVGDPPQGFCTALSTVAQNELQQKLQNALLVSGTAHDFNITLGDQPATLHFVGAYSTVDDYYLSIFGNGGGNAQ